MLDNNSNYVSFLALKHFYNSSSTNYSTMGATQSKILKTVVYVRPPQNPRRKRVPWVRAPPNVQNAKICCGFLQSSDRRQYSETSWSDFTDNYVGAPRLSSHGGGPRRSNYDTA
jgi:hypothetical protein